MQKEEVKNNLDPVYVVDEEDDDEETFTLDFENKTATSKVDAVAGHISFKNIPSDISIAVDPNVYMIPNAKTNTITSTKIIDSAVTLNSPPCFKAALLDHLIDSITSKAVSSLLEKHNKLDTELDTMLHAQYKDMGMLSSLITEDVQNVMWEKKQELKKCFSNFGKVDYEKIPEWAKEYVKDYFTNTVQGLAKLAENKE